MLFNNPLPDINAFSKDGDLNLIKGYLSALNDQLRFFMVNIDEENLSENLRNSIKNSSSAVKKWSAGEKINGNELADGTVSPTKLPVDSLQKNDLSSNPYGLNIGKELSLNRDDKICNITVTKNGLLYFSQGADSVPFSLALLKNNGQYFFYLVDSEGRIIGTIPLQTDI
ncbi:MAG: hypothetical protein IJ292_01420 [Clostridia bacterium]|nr:hypothetical protein [Clostridia bacterium]